MNKNVLLISNICTDGQKKKERNTPIYFNTNYRTEMKLVPKVHFSNCPETNFHNISNISLRVN